MPALLAHLVPLAPVEGVFTYAVPDALADAVAVGSRVVVPFGRREITGVVVETSIGEAGDAKAIADVLDRRPALPPDLLALTQWTAAYYLCPWGDALKAA